MPADLTFQNIFIELCGFLGSNEATIIQQLGEPSEIQEDETGKRYLHYDQYNAMFTMPPDFEVAELLACPVEIDNSKLNSGYYNFMGIDLRCNRNEIVNIWGQPTGAEQYVWAYNNKTGTTRNGYHFESRLLFNTNDETKLLGFGGMLYDFQEEQKHETQKKPERGVLGSILHALFSILMFFFDALGKLGKWLIRKGLKQ
jgi:hypothetical protein